MIIRITVAVGGSNRDSGDVATLTAQRSRTVNLCLCTLEEKIKILSKEKVKQL